MTLRGFLVRFALIYIALLAVISTAFHLLGASASSAGNAGALIGAVMGACLWFGHANQRYFSDAEKRSAVLGMVAVDAVLQLLVTAFALRGAPGAGGAGIVWLVLIFVVCLHAAVIWFFTGWAGKQLALDAAPKR